jgi:hypothetical protein
MLTEGKPLISEESEPLVHIVGNEFDLGWRSVWIHTPRESVRLVYTPEGLQVTMRPRRTDVAIPVRGVEAQSEEAQAGL